MPEKIFCRVLIALLFSINAVSYAAEGNWAENGPLQARLISPLKTLSGQTQLPLGLHLKLKPGWKTYWRVPGAAGVPPSLSIEHDLLDDKPTWYWPAPKRFESFGLQSYGYENQVVIPITYDLLASTTSLDIKGKAGVFACNDVCLPLEVPVSLKISADLKQQNNQDWDNSQLYNQFLSLVPVEGFNGTTLASYDDGGLYLQVMLENPGENAEIFLENQDVFEWPAPAVMQTDQLVQVWWNATPGYDFNVQEKLIFTYRDSIQAFSSESILEKKLRPAPPSKNAVNTWIWMMAFAVLGGLILNLMPCVLPILSIKIFSWTQMTLVDQTRVRQQSLATILGILSLFWLMAVILIAMQSAGLYIGWGIQFQNSYFLIFLLIVLLLFFANFMGWFMFSLPSKFQSALHHLGNSNSDLLKNYIQGATATLLATPCTAPFLGTAVAFAFSQSWPGILAIFTALGIGLSTPYILLIIFPDMVKTLPKPGLWMEKLKFFLAIGLLATAIWVFWLLSSSLSTFSLWWLGLAIIIFVLLLRFPFPRAKLIQTVVITLAFFSVTLSNNETVTTKVSDTRWTQFSTQTLNNLKIEGKTILVDVTADWCITCIYNKKVVIDQPDIQAFFNQHQVVLIQGDWTQPDSEIEALLSYYNRSGIPFNLVIGPGAPDGLLLPELLTKDIVRNSVLKANSMIN